jgi:cytochrome c-type biogenesis protein CcmH
MTRLRIGLVSAFSLVLLSTPAASAPAKDLETLAKRIEGQLMAPCCMMGTVSDHYSPVAERMRVEIRSMLAEGRTEEQILDFYVARHGEQILALPRRRGFNLLAYALPLLVFAGGSALLLLMIRRWRLAAPAEAPAAAPPPLDPADAERLRRELAARD